MMKLNLLLTLVVFCVVLNVITPVQARMFYSLESFTEEAVASFLFDRAVNPEYAWWTPYYDAPDNPNWVAPLSSAQKNSVYSLGGQLDIILGFKITSTDSSSGGVTSGYNQGTITFTEGYVGAGYFQWDGIDDNAEDSKPTKANFSPGLGSTAGFPYLPAHAAGGQTVDLTLAGAVTAFTWNSICDTDSDGYEFVWDFFDASNNTAKFTIPITQAFQSNQILFSNTVNAEVDEGWTGFSSIAAIQLAVYSKPNSLFLAIQNLNFMGYVVSGTIYTDCDCDLENGADSSLPGQKVTIRTIGTESTPSGDILGTSITNVNGYFFFSGDYLVSGSYQVCADDGLNLCEYQTRCRRVNLSGLNDPEGIVFIEASNSFYPPPDVSVACGDCSLPECTGFAMLTSCERGASSVP